MVEIINDFNGLLKDMYGIENNYTYDPDLYAVGKILTDKFCVYLSNNTNVKLEIVRNILKKRLNEYFQKNGPFYFVYLNTGQMRMVRTYRRLNRLRIFYLDKEIDEYCGFEKKNTVIFFYGVGNKDAFRRYYYVGHGKNLSMYEVLLVMENKIFD